MFSFNFTQFRLPESNNNVPLNFHPDRGRFMGTVICGRSCGTERRVRPTSPVRAKEIMDDLRGSGWLAGSATTINFSSIILTRDISRLYHCFPWCTLSSLPIHRRERTRASYLLAGVVPSNLPSNIFPSDLVNYAPLIETPGVGNVTFHKFPRLESSIEGSMTRVRLNVFT